MKKTESISSLAAALCQFQAAVDGAKKTADNPYYKSRYADLGEIWRTIRKPLTDNGLSVSQVCEPTEPGLVAIETILMHSSGEWISGTVVMTLTKSDPQGAGSAITYGRRYGLAAILGVHQEDDDAQSHNISKPKPAPTANAERAAELGSLRKQLKQACEGGLMTEAEIRKANLEHLGIEDAKNATNLDKIKEYSLYLARILDGDANNSDPTSFVSYDGSGEIIPPFIAALSDDQIEYLIGEYVAIEYPNDTAKSRAYNKYGSDPSAFLQHLFDRQSERIAKQAKPEAE